MKLHLWGAQFGRTSVVWWDLWARSLCWEVSRHRAPAASCGHKECTPKVCEWIS